MQVVAWDDDKAKKELALKLRRAKLFRRRWERQWAENRRCIGNLTGESLNDAIRDNNNYLRNQELGNETESEGGWAANLGTNYTFKYIALWHSQLSANPPSIVPYPTNSDDSSREAASAADKIAQYIRNQNDIAEVSSQQNIDVLILGTGYMKTVWDPSRGDVAEYDDDTNEITMEGDIDAYAPACEDVWLDPDARRKKDLRYHFELIRMPLEEARLMWPEKAQLLKTIINAKSPDQSIFMDDDSPDDHESELVDIYEYYEKAAPINGMAGRWARHLHDGTILERGKNPHYKAGLPIKVLTYIDLKNQVYGESRLSYAVAIQDELNQYDGTVLENLRAHLSIRLLVSKDSEIDDEALGDNTREAIEYSGQVPPTVMKTPEMMPDGWRWREEKVQELQDLFGVNDSMQGIQKRETSAVSQQTSLQTGMMIHNRLLMKYQTLIQDAFTDMLGIVSEEWTLPRQVLVLGKEHAFEAVELDGAAIKEGWKFHSEYGTSLPIDPVARRELLMLLMPTLKEAGMSMKQILRQFKLSEVDPALDNMELGEARQGEIFKQMLASYRTGVPYSQCYIKPRQLQDHASMLAYAATYVMQADYTYLNDAEKNLIEQHINERTQMMQAAGAANPSAAMASGVAPGALPAMGPTGGATGVQAIAGQPGQHGAVNPTITMPGGPNSAATMHSENLPKINLVK